MKLRVFFFHYNKPASMQQKRNVLTVHWKGACHLVHHVHCHVPIQTAHRNSQPRCVLRGRADSVNIIYSALEDGGDGSVTAIIT